MNAAVAYLVIACGSGGDNRTSKWSTNAIETRTGISRSRAAKAISDLERAGALFRDPSSAKDRPKYKIMAAHETPGCEAAPPAELNPRQQTVYNQLLEGWVWVPESAKGAQHSRWGCRSPASIASQLVDVGRARRRNSDGAYQAIPYDSAEAVKPDWIWLPNTLVEGAAQEVRPIELLRQTGDVLALRLLVDLYRAQNLHEDGGINFRLVRREYKRHKVAEQGPFVIWCFTPGPTATWPQVSFVAPHLASVSDEDAMDASWREFWDRWELLCNLGLIEMVPHLVDSDTSEGEVLHPLAWRDTGTVVERDLASAAWDASIALLTVLNRETVPLKEFAAMAPVARHIGAIQMFDIARLRYKPRTARTLAFLSREEE
jgi:hypothetical protein